MIEQIIDNIADKKQKKLNKLLMCLDDQNSCDRSFNEILLFLFCSKIKNLDSQNSSDRKRWISKVKKDFSP